MNNCLDEFLDGKIKINITDASVDELKTLDSLIDICYASGHRLYDKPDYARDGYSIVCSIFPKANGKLEKRLVVEYADKAIYYEDFIRECRKKSFKIESNEIMELFK